MSVCHAYSCFIRVGQGGNDCANVQGQVDFILYTHKGILLLKGQVQQEWQPLLTAPALTAWAEAGGLPELRKES